MKTTFWCSDRFQGPLTPQCNVYIKKSIICRNFVVDFLLDKLYNALNKDTSIKFHIFELIRTFTKFIQKVKFICLLLLVMRP